MAPHGPDAEWLEPDGAGGFASGTAGLIRTRRYHALLLTATAPPTGRKVLVNGVEAWIEYGGQRVALSSARYLPDVVYPDGCERIAAFEAVPWPRWRFALPDGAMAEHEILVDPVSGDVVLRWRCSVPARLAVRPLLTGRDYHALHAENADFDFLPMLRENNVSWRPYAGLPAITALSNGSYRHAPIWFRRVLYAQEQARGLDCVEDLASPGEFAFDLRGDDAVLVLRAGDAMAPETAAYAARIVAAEAARRGENPEMRATCAYVVRRGTGRTIVAGYPWFTDWGRDTFIAMRGLLLATGQIAAARSVLLAWCDLVSEGMLPNRFADDGPPEYNTADASLWFVVAVHETLQQPGVDSADAVRLRAAVDQIVAGHIAGTRFGIGVDHDGLLRAGEPGTQLTWMDARADGVAVTPRVGKPVEIQALWYNALCIAAAWNAALRERAAAVRREFPARFLNAETGGLFDVLDADGVAGENDAALRPNQIFAVGGLPFALLEGEPARRVLEIVQRELLTPMGLRTLARGDPHYAPCYAGGPAARDRAYHQGTVWPWLIGPFVEAWLRVHGDRAAARQFLVALDGWRNGPGYGHLPEVADAEPPHAPGGCPFQAWSLGEFLRAWKMTETERNG